MVFRRGYVEFVIIIERLCGDVSWHCLLLFLIPLKIYQLGMRHSTMIEKHIVLAIVFHESLQDLTRNLMRIRPIWSNLLGRKVFFKLSRSKIEKHDPIPSFSR